MALHLIERANPNRHGWVKLMSEDGFFYVREPGVDDLIDFDNLADAKAHYDACVKSLADTPNWEAQAEYDAERGTVNGYAPWQYNREY
jgi:hypothetical protein